MPRVRYIKPGFFKNEVLAECEPLARLLFSGLWTIADREGRLDDRPKRIKAELLPYDSCDVDGLLDDLASKGFLIRYEADGARYIQIRNFIKHQQPHYKEVASVIPAPPGHQDSPNLAQPVSEAQRQKIIARDGHKCAECGSTDRLSIDHIIPRSKGGTGDESNLRTLCKSCNSRKGNRDAASSGTPDDEGTGPSRSQSDLESNSTQGQAELDAPSPPYTSNSNMNRGGTREDAPPPEDINPLMASVLEVCNLNFDLMRQKTRTVLHGTLESLRGYMPGMDDRTRAPAVTEFLEYFLTRGFSDPTPTLGQLVDDWPKFDKWRKGKTAKATNRNVVRAPSGFGKGSQ